MKNKRAFTIVELLAVITIIAIILGIAVIGTNVFIDKASETFYENIEEELILAGSDFYNNNRNQKPLDGINNVDIKDLQNKGYIDKVVDKDGNDTCTGNVYIITNGTSYDYQACISCENGKYITNNKICSGDTSKPSCVIMLDKNWIVIGNSSIKATIMCDSSSSLSDSTINLNNLKTSTGNIKLSNIVNKSLTDRKVSYTVDVSAISKGTSKITLLANAVKNKYNKANSEVSSDDIKVYNKASEGKIVEGLIYNGKEQILVTGGVGVSYNQTKGINAGNYAITVTVNDGYRFSDGSTTKTLNTKIAKKKPVISISTATGSVNKGSEISFDETSDTVGTFTNTSQNASVATITSGSSNSVKANEKKNVKVKGASAGDTTVTISFKPTDTNNYEIPSNLTYKVSVKNNSGGYNTFSKSCTNVSGYCACVNGSCTSCGESSYLANQYCSGYTQRTHLSDCRVNSMTVKKCLCEKFRYSYKDNNGSTQYSGYSYSSTSEAYKACISAGRNSCSSYCNTNYSTYTYYAS